MNIHDFCAVTNAHDNDVSVNQIDIIEDALADDYDCEDNMEPYYSFVYCNDLSLLLELIRADAHTASFPTSQLEELFDAEDAHLSSYDKVALCDEDIYRLDPRRRLADTLAKFRI